MKVILHIDTSGEHGLVFISEGERILSFKQSNEQMQHASFLQPAVQEVLKDAGLKSHQIEVVSVSNGPGSYTGLRVGLASAKGLCFALDVPLIALSTLEIMAKAMQIAYANEFPDVGYCPMIDARRSEVFVAVYNTALQPILPPQPLIIPSDLLTGAAQNHGIICSGSGAAKWQGMTMPFENVHFLPLPDTKMAQVILTQIAMKNSASANLFMVEPFYQKAFFDTRKA